ncbi:SIS domain-containing protein [Leptothermofonsia sp. ETS-13]|uniref:SIS domain-containing protein n=1 Tax=Leptothermofonsia sp. ETS-13 TaxID=3035696 RepID=UPI003BA11A2A
MLKEIYEQPEVLQTCLSHYLSEDHPLSSSSAYSFIPSNLSQIHILGSGTSRHAGLVAQYWLEQVAGIPTRVRSASEFLSAPLPLVANTLTIAITQSGETSDTLAAARQQKNYSRLADTSTCQLIGITNQSESSLARTVDHILPILAGNEIGVAATKTFTTQLAVLACLTVHLAHCFKTISQERSHQLITELQYLPAKIASVLEQQQDIIQEIAQKLALAKHCIVLGQGVNRAIALEGALKLKETTYIHAEGYAAGEFLHGPVALLEPNIPVIAIVMPDQSYEQVINTVRKVKFHNVPVIGITATTIPSAALQILDHQITLPTTDELLSPFLTIVPLQLLAYYTAVQRGLDVDRPRNITKTLVVPES